MLMRAILLFGVLVLPTLASAADPSGGRSSNSFNRSEEVTTAGCVRRCADSPLKLPPSDRQASGKMQAERQVADLHARLRTARTAFAQSRANFDLLGIKLGDGQARVASLLAKEFPQSRDSRSGSRSGSECVPRSDSSRRNGDCFGLESKPSSDPSAYNPQTREVSVSLTDKGRVYAVNYRQSNLYVSNTVDGCERERDAFLAGIATKYGQPFSKDKQTITWGAAMPHDDFKRAYSAPGYTLMGVVKSLDGDSGLVNDAQRVIYFQGAFSLTAKCYGSPGDRITMGIDAFMADTRLEEQDSSALTSKPKL
jgi:hypothetical protein